MGVQAAAQIQTGVTKETGCGERITGVQHCPEVTLSLHMYTGAPCTRAPCTPVKSLLQHVPTTQKHARTHVNVNTCAHKHAGAHTSIGHAGGRQGARELTRAYA